MVVGYGADGEAHLTLQIQGGVIVGRLDRLDDLDALGAGMGQDVLEQRQTDIEAQFAGAAQRIAARIEGGA